MKNIFNKLKQITNKEFLKENINKVVLGILILIFLVSTLTYFLISRNISDLEYETIVSQSREYTNFLEDLDKDSNELDKYIIFSLDYSFYENGKNLLTSDEISDFLKLAFDKDISTKEIEDYGVNSNMDYKNITYDNTNKSYKITIKTTLKDLADTKVEYYKLEKIKKLTKSKYKATYSKYVIDNPYDALNYYIEKNAKLSEQENVKTSDYIDLALLKEYLDTGNLKSAKEFFNNNPDEIDEYAKKESTVKVEYEFVDNKLHITSY